MRIMPAFLPEHSMFRNLRLYRLHGDWPDAEQALSEQLAAAAFEPCGPFTERSSGWESPTDADGAPLCHRVSGADLMRLRTQSRVLPAAAVKEALEERAQAFRTRTLRDPGRKEMRQLRDDVVSELMPRALLRSERTLGFCLLSERLIGIDTASETRAERFLDQLRAALGSLEVTPLGFKRPIGQLLTRVFLGYGPPAFITGRECRMQDPAAGKAYVHWSDMDLRDADVRRHVQSGLKLIRLSIEFDGILNCVLDQDCVVRKLRLQGLDRADEAADEEGLARLDAEFVILTGGVRRLVAALEKHSAGC